MSIKAIGLANNLVIGLITILTGVSLLIFISCAPKPSPAGLSPDSDKKSAPAQEKQEGQWEKTLKTALKEGKVTIYSSDGGQVRTDIVDVFKKKFGLDIDWTTGSPSELQRKVVTERKAGLYIPDVVMVGPTTLPFFLKGQGVFQSMDSFLILPEIKDPQQWYQEKFPWFDEEHTTIGHSSRLVHFLVINTQLVKQGEITNLNDILDPKWKGKISLDDPTASGTGQTNLGMVASFILGWDYIEKLARQELFITRDYRLQVDWLAKGKYPVAFGARSEGVYEYARAGAPIAYLNMPATAYLTNGSSGISVFENAPHPNATAIYINWFLTKEGQLVYSKSRGNQSMRKDMPTEHLDPLILRDPKIKYATSSHPDALTKREEWDKRFKEIFAPYMSR